MNKRLVLGIIVFLFVTSSLACSISSLIFHTIIILEPSSTSTWDEASLAQARDIVQERLKVAGFTGASVTIISNGRLQVAFLEKVDLEKVRPLITGVGEIIFFDSESPLVENTPIPDTVAVIIKGSDISAASVSENQTGDYTIAVEFTPSGTMKIADYTSNHIGHYLVIARDGIVISSPVVSAAITDGVAIIWGNFTLESARVLAAQMGGGSLPFPLIVIETNTR